MKKKVYVLMISRVFPATHPRAGQKTYFSDQILHGQHDNAGTLIVTERRVGKGQTNVFSGGKIHTIRLNYNLWAKRAKEINKGHAVLSLRQWVGKPYRSKQREFLQLEKIGLQYCSMVVGRDFCYVDGQTTHLQIVAKNDGLAEEDFRSWFKKDFVGVILHFTDFKY